jgi:hypothetical protein
MSALETYTRAMVAGRTGECIQIEQQHGLFGYSPELVSIGLAAADRGESATDAIDTHIEDLVG